MQKGRTILTPGAKAKSPKLIGNDITMSTIVNCISEDSDTVPINTSVMMRKCIASTRTRRDIDTILDSIHIYTDKMSKGASPSTHCDQLHTTPCTMGDSMSNTVHANSTNTTVVNITAKTIDNILQKTILFSDLAIVNGTADNTATTNVLHDTPNTRGVVHANVKYCTTYPGIGNNDLNHTPDIPTYAKKIGNYSAGDAIANSRYYIPGTNTKTDNNTTNHR